MKRAVGHLVHAMTFINRQGGGIRIQVAGNRQVASIALTHPKPETLQAPAAMEAVHSLEDVLLRLKGFGVSYSVPSAPSKHRIFTDQEATANPKTCGWTMRGPKVADFMAELEATIKKAKGENARRPRALTIVRNSRL